MKIAEINMSISGSTGGIMLSTAEVARNRGHEVKTFSTHLYSKKYKKLPKAPKGHEYYGCYLDSILHFTLARFFGKSGTYSKFSTASLIRKLKKFKPDILQLHNLHNCAVNLPMLFKYIKKSGVKVVWSLHDCWSVTGHCPHFDMIGCEKWKTGCFDCPVYDKVWRTKKDTSKWMWDHKKEWFNGVKDMTIVGASNWIKGVVEQSYLKNYPVKIIENGIDLSVFKPTESDFRKIHGLEDKFIIISVADYWTERKGVDVFIELSKRLDDRFKIVLVGTTDATDKYLPKNILSIHRTSNQLELVKIYSTADVFVNPTREETFGLVNVEALACGTPVITFNTGGSPEIVDETCGIVVEKNDVDAMEQAIIKVCTEKPFTAEDCVNHAKSYEKYDKYGEYVDLYSSIINNK